MEIDDWRKRIDELTDTIISLLNQRAVYAAEIGKLKKEKGLPVFDAARENSVLDVVAEKAEKAGVHDWILDPGFGFAKTVEQNWTLLEEMDRLQELQKPILVGISRKSMIYRRFGITPEESLPATQVAHYMALQRGATYLRVHDVAEARRTIEIYSSMM